VPAPTPARNILAALHRTTSALQRSEDLEQLLQTTLACLREYFGIDHAQILMLDRTAATPKLYTVASHGYAESGVGAEIQLGEGVIGVAAKMQAPIRISHMTTEYAYGRAVRSAAIAAGLDTLLETEIP